jgi:hypothetical protein
VKSHHVTPGSQVQTDYASRTCTFTLGTRKAHRWNSPMEYTVAFHLIIRALDTDIEYHCTVVSSRVIQQ